MDALHPDLRARRVGEFELVSEAVVVGGRGDARRHRDVIRYALHPLGVTVHEGAVEAAIVARVGATGLVSIVQDDELGLVVVVVDVGAAEARVHGIHACARSSSVIARADEDLLVLDVRHDLLLPPVGVGQFAVVVRGELERSQGDLLDVREAGGLSRLLSRTGEGGE